MDHEIGFGQVPAAKSALLTELETPVVEDVNEGSGENAAAPWDNATSKIHTATISEIGGRGEAGTSVERTRPARQT